MDASTVASTASSRRRPDRTLGLAALVLALVAPTARGQAGADSSRAAVPVRSSSADSLRRPVRDRALDAVGILARSPGSFVYDFGTPGWPDGWSPLGLDPRQVGVELDGIPFEDPVTGAPIWELVPVAQIEPFRTTGLSHGRSDVVRADLRRSYPARPLTEMRYRSAGGGLQAVDVTHSQRRTMGGSTRLAVLLGYGGAGSQGEYDGSRLRRKRRLIGSVEIERGGWSLAITDVYNKNRVGAHGGVLPLAGMGYESIYNRLLADVEDPSAERIRVRNDLLLAARGTLAGSPLRVVAYRSRSTLQYTGPADTTTARMVRIGAVAEWPRRIARVPVEIRLSVYSESVRSGNAFGVHPAGTVVADASIGMARGFGSWVVDAAVGTATFDGDVRTSAHVALRRPFGPLGLHASAAVAHIPRSAAERHGFGPTFAGTDEAGPSRNLRVEGGPFLVTGPVRLEVTGFVRSVRDPLLLLLDSSGDTVRTVIEHGSVHARGVTVTAGIRNDRSRGVYVEGSGTWIARPGSGSVLSLRSAEALPEAFGQARVGARIGLFDGDLDLDLAVQARTWLSTAGLRLHAPTGLLALPDPASQRLPGSTIVDVTVDAGIRSATVFLALENILSGTTLVVGNQLVPDYPYPERRFRFGVYWPIFD